MNKYLHIIFLVLLGTYQAQSQIRLEWDGGSDYLEVGSYAGATTSNNGARVKISCQKYTGFKNWRLSVKITNYPVKENNDIFPADKISFIPVYTYGNINPLPSVSEIGIPPSVTLMNGSGEVYLVPKSNATLNNAIDNYRYVTILFDVNVAPGGYLSALQAWRHYIFMLEYTLYDESGNIIGILPNRKFEIHVKPLSGTPTSKNQYSISLSTEATNGILEFKTVSDYVNGKSVTYANGLNVSSTTSYQVTVKSIPSEFSSATGNTLPLDVIHLQVTNSSQVGNNISLSTSQQTILQGTSTGGNAVGYDIKYYTNANDSRLFNVPSDNYSTSLIYEISPR